MKLSEILAKVRDYIDEEVEESHKDTRLKRLIQTSANEVASMIMALDESHYTQDHETGFSIQPDVELYSLPTNCLRIKHITDENGRPLDRKSVTKRADYLGTGDTGYYYFQDAKIGFLDIPSSAKIFPYKFVRSPAQMDLNDGESIPDVPEFLCHDLIAVKSGMLELGIDEDDDTWLNKQANYLVNQIEEIYHRRSSDHPREIPSDDGLELDG